MNNMNKLFDYVKKQKAEDIGYTETSATPQATTPASVTSAGMLTEAPKVTDGGENVPRQDRLYLVDGLIPGTSRNPTDLGLKPYQGIEKKDAQFVDKRQIHIRHKGLLDEVHGDIHTDKSFGGIVINQDGQVLLRKPKGTGFGNAWTLAKGGAGEGEDGKDAALREVLEETGITGKIVKELPGHYNAEGKGNRFYLMEVDTSVDPQPFKGADTGDEETSEIKWVDLDEAMELLEKGEDSEKIDRDVQAVRQGHREWEGRNKRAAFANSMRKSGKKEYADAKQLHRTLGDEFAKNGAFPQDMRDNPYYEPLLAEIAKETFSPNGTRGSDTYTMLKGLMGDFLKKVDERRGFTGDATFSNHHANFASGWGGSALQSSVTTNITAHAIAEIRGFPESWMFGTPVPVDWDTSGKAIFRTDKLRNEMIKVYDGWQSKKNDGTGFFSNGEKYDFNNPKPLTYTVKGTHGKTEEVTTDDNWAAVMGRAKATKSVKDGVQVNWRQTENTYLEYAESYLSSQGKGDVYNDLMARMKNMEPGAKDELLEHGKEFVREYVRTAQSITQGLLEASLPEGVFHVYTVRKANNPREAGGDYGIAGSDPAGIEVLPSDSEDRAGGPGKAQTVYSGVIAGGSVNPLSWDKGNYAIFRRTNIRDIFMAQALWWPGPSLEAYQDERELIITNNPDSEARIVRNKGKLWKSGSWGVAPDGNGMHPANLYNHTEKRFGVTDSSVDYKQKLTKVTAKDNPMIAEHKNGQLGTNPGRLMKDKTGKQFYVKYSKEDGKNASENLANTLYEAAGIAVPHTELVSWGDDGVGTALKSDWIDDTAHHGTSDGTKSGTPPAELAGRPEIKHGFLVDCVLANWDVAGAGSEKPYGNLMEVDGKVVRIDQGGALQYSGLVGKKAGILRDPKTGKPIIDPETGEPKMGPPDGSTFFAGHASPQTNGFLDEIDTLRDSTINPTTAHVFQGMTEEDWDAASANLMKLTNSRIEDIVNDSAILGHNKNKMIHTLKSRRDAALNWWLSHPEIVGKTGYNSLEDLHSKSNLLKQDLFKAVDAELEAHKNKRVIWIDEEGYNERMVRTEEEQAAAEKNFERVKELMKI